MMSEENSCDGVFKKRTALGDVTNLVGKRGFSAISGGVGGDVENRKKGKSVKQVCKEVENIEYIEYLTEGNDKERDKEVLNISRPFHEINDFRDPVSDMLKDFKEDNQKISSMKNFQSSSIDDVRPSVGDCCVSGIAKPTSPIVMDGLDVGGNQQKDVEFGSLAEQNTTVCEQSDAGVGENSENEVGDDNLDSSKSESVDFFRFPESQESRSSAPVGCLGLNTDGLSDTPVGIDSIKACSCSFCTKAAYIWSDLHYQDIKGRLAAIKKCQKEANLLVQSSTKKKTVDIHGPENPDVLKLQSSLMGQWRSLFLHMEGIYSHESSQLEANLHTLKDVRDNCKTELELINGKPSEKQ